MQYLIALPFAAFVFGTLDALWLRWAGPNFYRPEIGEIMAEDFRKAPALIFYALYLGGMAWFVIVPALDAGSVSSALLNGAILGGLCYATYDLTSHAVLKVWSTKVTVADIAWGAFATAMTSAVSVLAGLTLAP